MKKIKIPIYGQNMFVVLFRTNQHLKELMDDEELQIDDEFDGFCTKRNGNFYICLRKETRDGVSYPTPGIIAHESKHLVNEVFSQIGQRLDVYNDEAECYLLGWVVNRVHEVVNENYE